MYQNELADRLTRGQKIQKGKKIHTHPQKKKKNTSQTVQADSGLVDPPSHPDTTTRTTWLWYKLAREVKPQNSHLGFVFPFFFGVGGVDVPWFPC